LKVAVDGMIEIIVAQLRTLKTKKDTVVTIPGHAALA
jgi:hypothetical protein